ncbi:MAG: restriction endonuclease subunit S [Psychromonas sp.]|nr:restriction endonuclease subunit S [Psychromonas sp.]
MNNINTLITDHIETWTSTLKKSTSGRGARKKIELYGIKKLRELILELAVLGKLVPQDPNDEPASILLERIAQEKAQLLNDKKIKKPKKLSDTPQRETDISLPKNWESSRVSNVINRISNGYSGKQNKDGIGSLLTRIETISKSCINFNKVGYAPEIQKDKKNEYKLEIGDILLSHINSEDHLGKTAIYFGEKELYHGVNLLLIRCNNNFLYSYFNLLMKQKRLSAYFISVAQHAVGQSSINQTTVLKTVISVPPLNEQHRIVEKVDELMLLCDQLEQQSLSSIETHKTLVGVLLNTLSSSKDANELNQNWARVSEFFDILFTTEDSIEQLKQIILQLAVTGKLVPQDPNDEPASKLLERIAAEKEQLIVDKKIKKQKVLPPIIEEEKPFQLPCGWEFKRLGNLTSKLGSGRTPRGGKSAYVKEGVVFLRAHNICNDGLKLDDTVYINDETHLKMSNTCVYPKDVLLNITGGSLGRSTIFPAEFVTANVSQHVTIIRLINPEMCNFLHLAILSPLVQKQVWGRQVGVVIEGLSKKVLAQFELPVPPLKEQYRIVTQVNSLMKICDQLKSNLYQAQQIQLNLTDALIAQLE